eukprot:14806077-Alexandrium_andersonii.AAC.1
MSASLVGSEMCIRDRGGVERPWSRERAGAVCRHPGCLTPPPPRSSPLNAVSYTHLTLPTICSV